MSAESISSTSSTSSETPNRAFVELVPPRLDQASTYAGGAVVASVGLPPKLATAETHRSLHTLFGAVHKAAHALINFTGRPWPPGRYVRVPDPQRGNDASSSRRVRWGRPAVR